MSAPLMAAEIELLSTERGGRKGYISIVAPMNIPRHDLIAEQWRS